MTILLRAHLLLRHVPILLCLAFMVIDCVTSQPTRNSNVSCIDSERLALLKFKTGLTIGSRNGLSDWNKENMECCRWKGIGCSKSGHVVTLDLRDASGWYMGGEISPSLLHLPYLNYLDLSSNTFTKIPKFVGSLKRLRYLNLSNNPFTGIIPPHLGNLSVLETLDLNQLFGGGYLQEDSMAWISKLTSLKYLDLSKILYSEAKDCLQSISKLPYLAKLYLQDCGIISSPAHADVNASTYLEVVDLFGNELDTKALSPWLNATTRLVNLTISASYSYRCSNCPHGPIPYFLSKLVSIKYLDLSGNSYEGAIPETFSNLSNLLTLDLSWNLLNKSSGFLQSGSNSLQELRVDNNFLKGHLPNLSKFPSLQKLNVAQNELGGSLDQLLWKSPDLSVLDVSSNHFSGIITEARFQSNSNLQVLSLSMNPLTLNFSTSFTPPFQLRILKLGDCKLGKSFPLWLRTQKSLVSLDISNSGISDEVPTWFWNISSRLQFLNVSRNNISGVIPLNSLASCEIIILSFNRFHGPVPTFSRKLQLLDLSSNTFSGSITFLCALQAEKLNHLDISNNLLSGNLPDCWERVEGLFLVNLNNNNFTGLLPNSMGKLKNLYTLSLRNNDFSGLVPQSLENCTDLTFLDLSENQFSGIVPKWIGTSLTYLSFLRLNSNRFGGKIPETLCNLNGIQILDLSFNHISGNIPSCLTNFTAMADKSFLTGGGFMESSVESGDTIESSIDDFTAWVFWKGLQVEFTNVENIKLLKLIDLSSNRLDGFIPPGLTELYALVCVNLSHNNLIGPIPDRIGQLEMLEVLDLSDNQLSGEIPKSMSNLTTLNYLDLSYNNLTGSIPISTQLQSFNTSMFKGNRGLCGAPLPNSCHPGGPNVDYDLPKTEERDGNEKLWMYTSIGLGFVVGFWGVCGPLLMKESWRQKHFHILDICRERFLVALLISFANLRRRSAA